MKKQRRLLRLAAARLLATWLAAASLATTLAIPFLDGSGPHRAVIESERHHDTHCDSHDHGICVQVRANVPVPHHPRSSDRPRAEATGPATGSEDRTAEAPARLLPPSRAPPASSPI